MNMMEAIKTRHSVRAYTDQPIDETTRKELQTVIDQCNREGDLSIKLVCNEPTAFKSMLARYGKFSNVHNYIILSGAPTDDLDERCGYYGEKIVLAAQELGLNTCWVGVTFKKRFVKKMIEPGMKLSLVIAVGYGATEGQARKSKSIDDVSRVVDAQEAPEWFTAGIEAALLAPTAVNQQKFEISLTSETNSDGLPLVELTTQGGSYTAIDLGIVRLHFEVGAGVENFAWKK